MKKVIALILALMMVVTLVPVSAFADTTPTFSIESTWAMPGSTVNVDVKIQNNPGLISTNLVFSLPDGMAIVGATAGDAFSALTMTPPAQLARGEEITGTCRFAWFSSDIAADDIKDGIILSLSVKIAEDAQLDDELEIGISSEYGDSLGKDGNPIQVQTVAGSIIIIDYTPGDVSQDGRVNMQDVVMLSRYIVDGCTTDPNGYNVTLKTEAADVNADGRINMQDVVSISRYIVDNCKTDPAGYNIKLLPAYKPCEHASMEHYAEKAATCTEDGNFEYWYCAECDKYFTDAEGNGRIAHSDTVIAALGHIEIADEGTPASPSVPGYTPGVWCDRCKTWLLGHEVIDPIAPNESNISYRHYVKTTNKDGSVEIANDSYLSTHEIVNPNPNTYVEGIGVAELVEGVAIDGKQVSANGYKFLGWYEKPEATAKRVYSISADETGDKILYGLWSKEIYTITYLPDSASSILPRVEDDSYSIDKETSLSEPPQWPNLVWIGWSDENGKIVKSIPKGTTGNITLTANWMSRRSQTVPNTKYASSKPAVAIDEEAGIYAFTYEIGDIQNVPIQQIESGVDGKGFNLLKGQTHEINRTFTQKVEQGEATSVADTIANATTKSDSWTLSEDWNKSSTFSEEHSNEVSQEQSQKASMSFTETGKYSLSSGIGGSKEHIDESGKSTKTTSKHEVGVSVNAGVKAGIKAGVTAATPFKNASVEASVGLDYKYTKETEKETHETHTDKTSSYWNVNEGFETSQSLSQTAEFASSLSQSIKDTYGYSETLDFGGSSSNTVSSSNTSSQSREYASSVTYSTEEGQSYTVVETLTADAETGYYRKVLAANFKVFAVVIYDMKSNTFSTMTYSLKIKDSEHLFTDYSTVSSFNDYENGVLPFEVPYFVSDYVYGLVGASEGVKVDDETGIVESYGFKDPATGICYKKYDEYTDTYSEPCDTDVIIPRYVVVTVSNNQKKIVPVTGISASAFSGSTVTSVYLSDKITEIPAGAFENCTALKYVRGGTIDTIGANAFKNCTSLFEFVLPNIVTSLGENAFMNVDALTVNVANPAVLDAALNSGVKALTVDLATMSGTIDGKKIVTPATMEYFSISGGGKVYNKVSVESGANTVVLNNLTINNYAGVPLKLTGSNLELSFVTINAGGLIMRLDADNTYVTLDGNNYLVSSGENAVLSKNIRFLEKEGSSATGKLRVTGNVLVYGNVTGRQYTNFVKDGTDFVILTETEYENYLNSVNVKYTVNWVNGTGYTISVNRTVSPNMGAAIGELNSGDAVYYGDVLEISYTPADYYHITANGKTSIVVDEAFNSDDIFAVAELNDVSDWVLAENVPEDAQVVEEKWSYDKTTTTTSRETSLSGYTQTGSEWIKSGSGSKEYCDKFSTYAPGFDTSHWIYTNMSKSAYSAYETATEKRVVSNSWAGWIYWHWMYNTDGANAYNRAIYYQKGNGSSASTGNNYWYGLFGAFKSTNNYSGQTDSNWNQNDTYYKWYHVTDRSSYADTQGSYWWYRMEYWTSTYTDYYKLFHYSKTENLESDTEVTAADGISNIQAWVRYRAK